MSLKTSMDDHLKRLSLYLEWRLLFQISGQKSR